MTLLSRRSVSLVNLLVPQSSTGGKPDSSSFLCSGLHVLSYGHLEKIEAQRREEVQALLAKAETADRAASPEGFDRAAGSNKPTTPKAAVDIETMSETRQVLPEVLAKMEELLGRTPVLQRGPNERLHSVAGGNRRSRRGKRKSNVKPVFGHLNT